MSWTPEIISVTEDPMVKGMSVTEFKFTHTDGRVEDKDIERGLNRVEAVKYAREKVQKLESDDLQLNGMKDYIASPPIGPIDISIPAEVITPDQQALIDFNVALQKARQAKEIADLKTSQDPDVVAAVAEIDTAQASIASAKQAINP